MPARTVSRILRRHHVPRLAVCDPMTGEVIRASKTTAVRYERERPGELVHMDVKKIGRIPDGGGWRAHGRADGLDRPTPQAPASATTTSTPSSTTTAASRTREILADEQADHRRRSSPARSTASPRTASRRSGHDRQRLELHAQQRDLRRLLDSAGIDHMLIKPHCPWQNGKVERFNRTLQTEWAYRTVFTTNDERTAALAPWLEHYNTHRRHSALGGLPPISRLSPT